MNWPTLSTRTTVLTGLGLVLLATASLAQPADEGLSGSDRPPVSSEREAAAFYLRDRNGNLILVPDFSFERWERLTRLERNLLPATPPRHRFTEPVRLTGEAQAAYVLIEASCAFELMESEAAAEEEADRWFRIPVRFDQAIRTPEFTHAGEGEVFWTFDANAEGHVIWVRAQVGSRHRVNWTMKLPLTRRGDLSSIALKTPSTAYRFELTVPGDEVESFQGPASEAVLQSLATQDGQTRTMIEGAGGDLQLNWRAKGSASTFMEAQGTVQVRVMGGEVDSTANILVKSYADPVSSFAIRIPPGAELIPLPSSELDIQLENGEQDTGSVVRVSRRDGEAASEFEVVLQTLRPSTSVESDEPLETAGFEVLGAVRQWGSVDFEVDSEWTVDWLPGDYVRRESPAMDAGAPRPATARFIYNRQPYSLKAKVSRRVSRISVEPSYLIDVRPRQLSLDSRLSYRFSGSRAKVLRIQMPGWDVVEDVQPADAIESFELVEGRLSIYLTPNTNSDLELRLTARQTVSDSDSVTFQLPQPVAPSAAPPTVAVLPADNIQLSPRDEELIGLITESLPIEIPLPESQQPAFTYRGEANAPLTVFSADMEVLPRQIDVAVESALSLAPNHVEVQQSLQYSIQHEPVNQLRLEIPERLAETGEWEVTMDGVQLPVVLLNNVSSDLTSEAANERPILVVTLREPQIGNVELSLQYRLAFDEEFRKSQSTVLVLGLAQPAQEESTAVIENQMRISTSDFFDSKQVDRAWEVVQDSNTEGTDGDALTEPLYRATGRIDSVTTEVVVALLQEQDTLVLEKAWLQSWLTADARRDRACFRFRTDRTQIELAIPEGATGVEVMLNGELQSESQPVEGQLRLELGDSIAVREHIVEMWYWYAPTDASLKQVRAVMPDLIGAERAERIFWQLVLPANDHLVWSPPRLTSELTWRRGGLLWRREPNRRQRQLENLLAASPQDGVPTSTNQYLFSSVGPTGSVEFYTARRATLVTCVSGLVLACGLLLIYFPRMRHPAALLTIGVLVLALALAFAEVALLIAQAAGLGIALVLFARLFQWTMAIRPRAQYTAVATTMQRRLDRDMLTPSEPGSSRLTTVSPAAFRVSATEAES